MEGPEGERGGLARSSDAQESTICFKDQEGQTYPLPSNATSWASRRSPLRPALVLPPPSFIPLPWGSLTPSPGEPDGFDRLQSQLVACRLRSSIYDIEGAKR